MDVFPSVMEYLRVPLKEEWKLDGRSRLQWAENNTEVEKCELTHTKAVITLSGGYMLGNDGANDKIVDECLATATDFGQFHYTAWSHCAVAKTEEGKAPELCAKFDQCDTYPE